MYSLFFLLGGCHSSQPIAHKIQVPFVFQEPQHCGAAALAMVLSYHDLPFQEASLRDGLYVPVLGGTTPELLADYARKGGLDAFHCAGTLDDLWGELSQGRPIIALWGPTKGSPTGHFVVVTGYNERSERVRVHDGLRADRWMSKAYFMTRWGRSQNTMIRLLPVLSL